MRLFLIAFIAVLLPLTMAHKWSNKAPNAAFMVQGLPVRHDTSNVVTVRQQRLTVKDAERLCLAQVVYYEARGEPTQGQLAVAQVALNRAAEEGSVCVAAYAPGQFALTIEKGLKPPRGRDWKAAQAVAVRALRGQIGMAGKPTHFHTVEVSPYWSRSFRRLGQIGDHVFYEGEI
jgi:spore germination cell wall hydrolase CwlJ-like protein